MNKIIATGHMMRCLSIADAMKELGEQVTFLIADENPIELLEQRGYPYIVLHSVWNELEGELDTLCKVIQEKHIDKLLIDHYYVTENYLKAVEENTRVFYLDDLNAFVYPVSNVICYANYYRAFDYETRYRATGLSTNFILGPSYMPLRSAYQGLSKKQISENIRKVLILSGGSDPYDSIRKILAGFQKEKYEKIYAICGRYYEDIEGLRQENPEVTILPSVDNLEDYMKDVDLIVSAAGTTLYELSAVGTPAISFIYADNQRGNATSFDQDGIIPYAGDVRVDDVASRVQEILASDFMAAENRQKISKAMQELVDGNGAIRLAKKIKNIC